MLMIPLSLETTAIESWPTYFTYCFIWPKWKSVSIILLENIKLGDVLFKST